MTIKPETVRGTGSSPSPSLIEDLYEASIDFGAHPNAYSLLHHVSIADVQAGTEVTLGCLYGEEDVRLHQSLLACAETSIATAFLAALVAVDHPLIDPSFSKLTEIYQDVQIAAEEMFG